MSGTPLVLSCHHCGASFQRVQLVPGQWAQCVRCDSVLETYATFTPSAWLAVVCAAILTLALANAYPVATLVVQGAAQPASFFDAVAITWQTGYPEVALLTLAAGFVLPAVHLGLLAWILCWLVTGRLPPHFDRLVRTDQALVHGTGVFDGRSGFRSEAVWVSDACSRCGFVCYSLLGRADYCTVSPVCLQIAHYSV